MSTRKKQDKPAAEPAAQHVIDQPVERPQAQEPAAAVAVTESGPTHVMVVANKRTGRYRAGRFWPPEPTRVAIDDIDDESWAAMIADPALTVTPEV